jgi:hypothetical protein
VDYTSAILVVVVAVYALVGLGPPPGWSRAACPRRSRLGAYHAAAFGHPLALPYDFAMQEHRRQGWFMGITAPDPRIVWAILAGSYRGLFYGAALADRGSARPGRARAPALRGRGGGRGAVFLAYLLLNAGLVDWPGGWAMGPRYLIPAIPSWPWGRWASCSPGRPGRGAGAFSLGWVVRA